MNQLPCTCLRYLFLFQNFKKAFSLELWLWSCFRLWKQVSNICLSLHPSTENDFYICCFHRNREWCMRLVYQEFYQHWSYLLQNAIIWLIGLHHVLLTSLIILSLSWAAWEFYCVCLHVEWKMCNQTVCLSLSKALNQKRCIVNKVPLSFTNTYNIIDYLLQIEGNCFASSLTVQMVLTT